MNQTESSMSEGYSFFNNLSAGSDKINSVSRDCATRSSSSISSSPSSTSYFIVYNNNNVITKDHPPPLQKQYLRSQKGLRSPHHLQQSQQYQQNHMSTLSWSSASCDSSEISYDSINSDSTNESTTTTTTTTTAPSSSSTSTITTAVTTSTTTTSSTQQQQQQQQQPTKSDTTTSNTATTNASTNGQLVSTLCVASRDSTLTTSTQPISTPTKTSAHQQHINRENRKPGYLPCTPTPRSFRYPSFISFNHISSEMGRPNSYDSFEYQQYQQFVQQQQQKYQQQLLQNISDENESCVSDQHDETSSNQQKQQQLSSISDIEPQEQQQQSNQESSSSSTENQSSQHQASCSSSNENLSSQPQQEQEHEQEQESSIENESQQQTPSTTVLNTNSTSLITSTSSSSASENESSSEDEMELPENCHYSPPKSVDRDAASRLAKRLYNLEGFKRSDVCRHLSKNNDFSRIVAEEYLKFFNFEGDTLDGALRRFLFSFCLIGETQERERVLQHFSKRYLDCNPDTLKSADALHTLTCAIMLLNTDLHGESVGRKMTCNEFIDNLSDLNDGQNFPRDVLVSIYQSIKAQPLKWALDEDAMVNGVNSRIGLFGSGLSSSSVSSSSSGHLNPGGILGSNPFLKLPNPNTATEYKRGYIMRKCCFDMNGKKTPFGKRGWKMFYATLRDLVLFLHKDEQGCRKNQLYESLNNSIRIHHAMAAPATDYTKKQYVFRLQTADQSEYLFQTSDAQELQSWIDTINLVAGTLSAPPLPSAVGSQSKKFQKPLLPSSHTKFNTKEQLADHEARIQRIAQELEEHVSKHPDKGSQRRLLNEYAEKQSYLEFELKRYSAYASILRTKLQQVLGSGALLEGPSKSMSPLSSKSKPLTQLSIGEEQDIDEEKWAEDGHEYQEQISVQPVKRSHR